MRAAFGRADFVVNGVIFTLYHLHQPWSMPATLLDGTFAQAYPSSRFRSTWMGLHAHRSQRAHHRRRAGHGSVMGGGPGVPTKPVR